MKFITSKIIINISSSNFKIFQIHINPSQCLQIPSTFNSMCKIIILSKISNMCMSTEKLNGYGWEVFPNRGKDEIVFESSGITKRSVTYDNDKVNVVGLVAQDGLKPWFVDHFIDRL